LSNGVDVGQNGFVSITINGGVLTLDYRDIDNRQLLVERFTAGAGGSFTYDFTDPSGILKPAPGQ
jgi:hypothetical protein